MKLKSTNPASNYDLVGEVDVSSSEEIKNKVIAAQKVKTEWKELGVEARIKLLEPIRDEFASRINEIAELISLETGKPISESISEVDRYTNGELSWFLENGTQALQDEVTLDDDISLHKIRFEPRGVAVAIAPWNFPFGMAIWGIFPNLIAGNPVIFKTSEECPLTGRLIEQIIDNHNLPEGVFSEVYGSGDVGRQLVQQDVDFIWFTGSTTTGKQLYKTAADKFIGVVLEMGGSNPCVVFEDADLSKAAATIFGGRFQNCGQVCSAIKRLIVHESVAEELTGELVKLIDTKVIGNALNKNTDISSLVAKRQQELVNGQLQDALADGAEIVHQLEIPGELSGAFVEPTLLKNVDRDMRVWKEEVFGPILPIVTFSTEQEAVELANDTIYGLGALVISGDTQRALRVAGKIDAGSIGINYESRFAPCDPFGGFKSSGMGRERGIHGLRELCQIKVLHTSKTGQTSI
jgi:succinate-semialdehyde dehydrogenase/glutarate-semialdehyde dehydrogenase